MRAKIGGERNRLQRDAGDACGTRAQEQPDLRFAETVNRLHRIAHRKYAAAVAWLPARGQLLDELVLADRGVLEFVDQQMANTVIERKRQISRALAGFECAQCSLRDLGEIDLPARPEDEAQLRNGA